MTFSKVMTGRQIDGAILLLILILDLKSKQDFLLEVTQNNYYEIKIVTDYLRLQQNNYFLIITIILFNSTVNLFSLILNL